MLQMGREVILCGLESLCVFLTDLEAQVPENQTHVCHQLSARGSQYQSPDYSYNSDLDVS